MKVLGHKPDDHVCHCVKQKVVIVEAAPAAEGATATAEPERIGGKKPEEGAEGADGAKAAAAPKKEEKKEAKK